MNKSPIFVTHTKHRRLKRTLTNKRRLWFVWFTKIGDLFTKLGIFEVFFTLHGIQKAPEALVWLTNIQGCRVMAPRSYQCQKVKEGHSYIHKGKRRRTYWRLSDFQRSSRILMIFWAIPWLQKGAGSELGLQRRLWVCKMTQYMYPIVRDISDHLNVMHTSKAPSVFKN